MTYQEWRLKPTITIAERQPTATSAIVIDGPVLPTGPVTNELLIPAGDYLVKVFLDGNTYLRWVKQVDFEAYYERNI